MAIASSNDSSALCFLDLPLDIREHIYKALLHLIDEPDPKDHEPRSRISIPGGPPFTVPLIFPYPTLPTSIPINLLLTNHQLHSELLSIIESRSRAHANTYSLELISSGIRLYPTWTYLPAPPQYTSRVHVYFRMTTLSDEIGNHRWWGNGGPAASSRALLQILSEFLVYGPALRPLYPAHPTAIQPPITLDEITVEFVRHNPGLSSPRLDVSPFERDAARTPEEDDIFELMDAMATLADSGQLWGRVKKVKLLVADSSREWLVPEVSMEEMVRTAHEWSPYGWQSMAKMIKREM